MPDRTGAPGANDDLHVWPVRTCSTSTARTLYSVVAGRTIKLPPGHYMVDGYTANLQAEAPGFEEVTYFTEPDW